MASDWQIWERQKSTEVNDLGDLNLTICYGLQLTPESLGATNVACLPARVEVRKFLAPRKPRAVILGRGSGGALQAVRDTLQVTHAIDQDWMTFACILATGRPDGAELVRQPLEMATCHKILAEAKPEILLGNAYCRIDDPELIGATERKVANIVEVFVSSRAQILVMELPVRFAGSEYWRATLQTQLERARCEFEAATLKAIESVGVPTNNKQRVFVCRCRQALWKRPPGSEAGEVEEKVERAAPSTPSVGAYLGHVGYLFLKRGRDAKEIFSFDEPTVSVTMEQIMARKPSEELFGAHPKMMGRSRKPRSYHGLTSPNSRPLAKTSLYRRRCGEVM